MAITPPTLLQSRLYKFWLFKFLTRIFSWQNTKRSPSIHFFQVKIRRVNPAAKTLVSPYLYVHAPTTEESAGGFPPFTLWNSCLWWKQLEICQWQAQTIHLRFTLYTLTSGWLFPILLSKHFLCWWQGEFVLRSRASSAGSHFLSSHDFNIWFRDNNVRRNGMVVILKCQHGFNENRLAAVSLRL